MHMRQRLAVRFHLLGIEQFGAQRRLAFGGGERGLAAREQVDPFGGGLQGRPGYGFHQYSVGRDPSGQRRRQGVGLPPIE
ncbi:hypothetical protein G6F63_015176 [Rhizopus arrhizus]|nr:hypothetical protein G6F63_015176 [Rhizopus arrhizus]